MTMRATINPASSIAFRIGCRANEEKCELGRPLLDELSPSIDTDDPDRFALWVKNLKELKALVGSGELTFEQGSQTAKQAAKNGNWEEFATAIGKIESPPVTLKSILHKCCLLFLEHGHVNEAKMLADLIPHFSKRGEREVRIFEKTEDALRVITVLGRGDLDERDFKVLGHLTLKSPYVKEAYILAAQRDQAKDPVIRKSDKALRTLLVTYISDPENFLEVLGLFNEAKGTPKETAGSAEDIMFAIRSSLRGNSPVVPRNLQIAFSMLKDYKPPMSNIPVIDNEIFFELFQAEFRAFMGQPFEDHMKRAECLVSARQGDPFGFGEIFQLILESTKDWISSHSGEAENATAA